MCAATPWRDFWKGWGDDRDPALVADPVERLVEGEAALDALLDAEREDVADRAGDLHADDADKAVVRRAHRGLDAGVDLVVVGDRKRVEPDSRGLFEQ